MSSRRQISRNERIRNSQGRKKSRAELSKRRMNLRLEAPEVKIPAVSRNGDNSSLRARSKGVHFDIEPKEIVVPKAQINEYKEKHVSAGKLSKAQVALRKGGGEDVLKDEIEKLQRIAKRQQKQKLERQQDAFTKRTVISTNNFQTIVDAPQLEEKKSGEKKQGEEDQQEHVTNTSASTKKLGAYPGAFRQFVEALRHHRILYNKPMTNLFKAFRLLDQNGDGTISRTEFEQVLKRLDIAAVLQGMKTFDALINIFDKDHDGTIDLSEFEKALKPFISQKKSKLTHDFAKLANRFHQNLVEWENVSDVVQQVQQQARRGSSFESNNINKGETVTAVDGRTVTNTETEPRPETTGRKPKPKENRERQTRERNTVRPRQPSSKKKVSIFERLASQTTISSARRKDKEDHNERKIIKDTSRRKRINGHRRARTMPTRLSDTTRKNTGKTPLQISEEAIGAREHKVDQQKQKQIRDKEAAVAVVSVDGGDNTETKEEETKMDIVTESGVDGDGEDEIITAFANPELDIYTNRRLLEMKEGHDFHVEEKVLFQTHFDGVESQSTLATAAEALKKDMEQRLVAKENSEFRKRIENLESELKTEKTKFTKLVEWSREEESQRVLAESNLSQLQQQHSDLTTEFEAAQEQNNADKLLIASQEKEIKKQKNEIEILEFQNQELQRIRENHELQIKTNGDKYAELDGKYRYVTGELSRATKEVAKLTKHYHQDRDIMEKEHRAQVVAIEDLLKEKHGLLHRCQTLEYAFREKTQEMAHQLEEMRMKQRDTEMLALDRLNQLNKAKTNGEDLLDEFEAIKKQLCDEQSALRESNVERIRLESEVMKYSRKYEEAEAAVSHAKNSLQESERKVNKLLSNNQSMEERNSQLMSEIRKLENRIQTITRKDVFTRVHSYRMSAKLDE
eukprot:g2555.t1